MAFKSVNEYNGNLFKLPNDNDSADVVFLYRSSAEQLIADAHYIKSPDYSGYAHCCGVGCPACGKGWKVENHFFIPLYNIQNNRIEFFDRSTRFLSQMAAVFSAYPNPSEYVFKIIRHGVAGSRDTRYEIRLAGKNTYFPYDNILSTFNAKMPDYYENVVKSLTIEEMSQMIDAQASITSSTPGFKPAVSNESMQEYVPTPRAGYQSAIPEAYVPVGDVMGEATSEPEAAPVVNTPSVEINSVAFSTDTESSNLDDDEVPPVTF